MKGRGVIGCVMMAASLAIMQSAMGFDPAAFTEPWYLSSISIFLGIAGLSLFVDKDKK